MKWRPRSSYRLRAVRADAAAGWGWVLSHELRQSSIRDRSRRGFHSSTGRNLANELEEAPGATRGHRLWAVLAQKPWEEMRKSEGVA